MFKIIIETLKINKPPLSQTMHLPQSFIPNLNILFNILVFLLNQSCNLSNILYFVHFLIR